MAERIVNANGVDLCVETFGDRRDPAILLIAGAASSMLHWEEDFCERLAAGPRFVIRYDQRDTGRSVTYEPGAPPYSGRDLLEDAVGVLDALGIDRAHLVGISMGGAMAQLLALDYPDRVASLTLVSTSPAVGSHALPPSSSELGAYFAHPPPEPDWSDRAAVIDYLVEDERVYAARSRPFDEAGLRERAARIVDRSRNIESTMKNHFLVDDGEASSGRLGAIAAPTLVVHGAEDPLFPLAHGEALASEIPGARLIVLDQTGHELPARVWDQVVPAVLAHTSGD